jgi:hypothetical protein
VALQIVEEKLGHTAGVDGIAKAGFVRKVKFSSQGSEPSAGRPSSVLRVVHMQVDEARRDETSRAGPAPTVGKLVNRGAVVTEHNTVERPGHRGQ